MTIDYTDWHQVLKAVQDDGDDLGLAMGKAFEKETLAHVESCIDSE